MRRFLLAAAWTIAGFGAGVLHAATALTELRVSPDTTVTLGTPAVEDENVASDNLTGTVSAVGIGAIPPETDLDGYARSGNGYQLLSFDTTVVLPGGITAKPGDVVRYNGVSYAIEFDASAHGIPGNASVDAVAIHPTGLLLSFDVTVDLGSFEAAPADLVLFDAGGSSMFFDGSALGVPEGLDLDAADYLVCNDNLLLSFDGSGTVGGVAFDDEDALEYDGAGAWSMAYDGSAHDPNWVSADLDAIHATVNLGPGPPVVFGQTVLAQADKITFSWGGAVSFRVVRGSFATSTAVGTYGVNSATGGTGISFVDATVPASGTGAWYLVKPSGCTQTSWQSVLGAEAGRDTAIP